MNDCPILPYQTYFWNKILFSNLTIKSWYIMYICNQQQRPLSIVYLKEYFFYKCLMVFLTTLKKRTLWYDLQIFITIIAWEPSAPKVTKSYSRRLPAIERVYRETKFSLFKSTHSIKNLKTKLHSRGPSWFHN